MSRGAALAPVRAGRFIHLSRGAALVKHARVSRLGSVLSTRKLSAQNLLSCFSACSGNDEDGERPAAGGGSPLCLQAPAAASSSAFCSCFAFTSQLMTSLIAESSVQLTAHSRLLKVCEKNVRCPSAAQTHPCLLRFWIIVDKSWSISSPKVCSEQTAPPQAFGFT